MAVDKKAPNVVVCTAEDDADTGNYYITKIKWVGADIADGDEIKVTDTAGNVIFHDFAEATKLNASADWNPKTLYAKGFIIDTLTTDHGTVYLYHK